MKITFEINTQDPEQQSELRQLQKAKEMAYLLLNFRESILARIKFEDELPPQFIEGLQNSLTIFNGLCQDASIDIDDLTY